MSRVQASSLLSACLIAERLVPEECCDIMILMPPDGLAQLSYRVNVRHVDLEKLGRAFARAAKGEEAWPIKDDGGHLPGCYWDTFNRKYVCADGCEIRRINESTRTGGIVDGLL